MFQSITIKVDKWATEHVASWIKGLDSSICGYHSNFVEHKINGKRLLILDHHDLSRIGVRKVGHQEAILESLELLLSIHNDLNSCNLQSLALTVNCRINYVHRILEQQEPALHSHLNRELIDSVCYLVKSLKNILLWLRSAPFANMDEFIRLHETIGRATLAVIGQFSRSNQIQYITRNKSYILDKLAEIERKCDDLVKRCADPIILTPASLENVTVRKRADEPLGLHLQSTQQGVHTIKLIRENTACENISKLEPGDQIIQVNQQVVIGWQLPNVVNALKERPKEVTLTIRKSPRHFNPLTFNQRRPSPKTALTLGEDLKLKQSTLPKRLSKHGSDDGSFDGKMKSSSIGEAPANVHVTAEPSTPSAYDDVFSLASTIDSVSPIHPPFEGERFGSESRDLGAGGCKSPKPTILVNDIWDPQNLPADSQPATSVSSGKREVLSSFHVVKSTPELRAPDAESGILFPPQ